MAFAPPPASPEAPADEAASEVCRITADLIRIDTTNWGGGNAVGERAGADYVESLLAEVGISCQRYEKAAGRTNLIARWRGSDPSLPGLVLHGHLDVVPADPDDWSVDPFGGVLRDGMIWGRGAVDMKNMVAMIVTAARTLATAGVTPRRDIVLAFLADEEDNSHYGSRWLVAEHPEVFAGADVAISEVGGFSVDVGGRQLFLIQSGEKGILSLRLRARGRARHASLISAENAVVEVARAVVRIGDEPWPVTLTETTTRLLDRLRELTGAGAEVDHRSLVDATAPCSAFVVPGLTDVANPTVLDAGQKVNIVPAEATARIDVRVLPGRCEEVLARVRELAGPRVEVVLEDEVAALENGFDLPLIDAIRASLTRCRPDAAIAPYLLPAGTDNAILADLGIRGFGFVPLLLPPGFDFPAMFHGPDERVPVESLVFGERVLRDLISTY